MQHERGADKIIEAEREEAYVSFKQILWEERMYNGHNKTCTDVIFTIIMDAIFQVKKWLGYLSL